eukprot:1159437-Pelagomonas_calceolata.AAC.12
MRGPRCIACPRAQHPTQLQGSHFGWAAASVTTKAHRTWSPVTIAVRMDAACRCAMVGALSGLSLKKGHNKRTASNSEQQSQRGREQERHCVKLASDVVISNCTEISRASIGRATHEPCNHEAWRNQHLKYGPNSHGTGMIDHQMRLQKGEGAEPHFDQPHASPFPPPSPFPTPVGLESGRALAPHLFTMSTRPIKAAPASSSSWDMRSAVAGVQLAGSCREAMPMTRKPWLVYSCDREKKGGECAESRINHLQQWHKVVRHSCRVHEGQQPFRGALDMHRQPSIRVHGHAGTAQPLRRKVKTPVTRGARGHSFDVNAHCGEKPLKWKHKTHTPFKSQATQLLPADRPSMRHVQGFWQTDQPLNLRPLSSCLMHELFMLQSAGQRLNTLRMSRHLKQAKHRMEVNTDARTKAPCLPKTLGGDAACRPTPGISLKLEMT